MIWYQGACHESGGRPFVVILFIVILTAFILALCLL